SWKRHDGTPQEPMSDGYATGLIVYALQRAGLPRDNTKLQQGLAWLVANQDKSQGFWHSYSLNKNVEHHISPGTALFMNDAATASKYRSTRFTCFARITTSHNGSNFFHAPAYAR